MFKIVRTVFGLVIGWVVSAVMGLLGRYHSQGALTVHPDRRQFVRNATLGAVGTVLTLSAASLGLLLWPRKTGAFGSELTVKAADVPAVDGDPFHNIQGKFYLVRNNDGLLASAVSANKDYICQEVQALDLNLVGDLNGEATEIEMDEFLLKVKIEVV